MAAADLLRIASIAIPRAIRCCAKFSVTLAIALPLCSWALVLPEDRADAMYHAYDGGGVTVDGPSILVRKGYKEKVYAYVNY